MLEKKEPTVFLVVACGLGLLIDGYTTKELTFFTSAPSAPLLLLVERSGGLLKGVRAELLTDPGCL